MWKLAVVASLVGSVARAETKPAVSVGTPQVVVGAFDVAAATKVVKTAQAKVLACYVDLLGGGGGSATAVLKLGVDGKVTSATVTGLTHVEPPPVENCMADALSKLRFARPKDGAVVDLSIVFTFTGGKDLFGEVGEPSFGWGYGVPGRAPAGSGGGWGTIGTGRYGTIGGGGGTGVGFGTRAQAPTTRVGQPTATGELDRAIIRRYIKRNIGKIQYCYEKELLATPTLAGTVTVQFTISSHGTVSSATGSGMSNPSLASCVAAVIKGIEFPKPRSGDVVVRYPFTFSPPPPPKKKS